MLIKLTRATRYLGALLNIGGAGGAGGAGFIYPDSADRPFATVAARNTWAAANLGDLVDSQTVVLVDGAPQTWYLWTGDTNPSSHDATDWIDATPLVQGPAGQDGAASDLSGVSDRNVPFNDNGSFADSPIRVLADGQAFISGVTNIEGGTLGLGPFIDISERGGFIGTTNAFGDEFTLVDYRTPQDAPSSRPRILAYTEAENNFVVQSEQSESLSSPVSFNYTPTLLARTNALTGEVGTDITGLRLRIANSADVTQVLKYWPSEADWRDGTGRDFAAGTMTIDFEDTELPLNQNTTLQIDIVYDSGTLLGNAAGVPAITAVLQRGEFIDLAYFSDIAHDFLEITADVTITPSNLSTYNRKTLYVTNAAVGDIDISLSDGLDDFEFIDVLNFSNLHGLYVREVPNSGVRVNGESDVRFTQFEGGRVVKQPGTNTYAIIFDNTDPDMVDNYVDTLGVEVSGQTLTVTLGRTGNLPDLVRTATLPGVAPAPAAPSVHNLTIDIPSRVDLNTNLNTAHTIGFDVSNYGSITDFDLIVTTGDDVQLVSPTRDGDQQQSVTLSGIDTSSAGSVVFQLQATHAGGTVTSNAVTVEVRDLQDHEYTYVNTQADRLPANFSTTGANQAEYQSSQTIAIPTFANSRYVVIAQLASEPDISSIMIGGLEQVGTFEKVAGTAQVGGQTFEFYYSRNTLLGSVVSGTELTITRG